jgi:hypothetical protein
MDLSKKIFGSNIDPEIQEYFKNLQKGTFDIQPGDSLSDTSFDSSTQTYLGDRTPYARMWTAVNVSEVERDIKDEYKTKQSKNSVYIVNDNSFNSYESSELDSVSELGNNPLLKPAAGVTEVTSRAEGSLGALRRTVVKFVVHNKEDFDKTFLPFFLKPGSHIFVDFGWSDKAFSLYDPNDFISNTDLEMTNFVDKIYNDDDKIKSGFTTTVSGQVIKYDVNINQNQSFECTLEFVSANYQLLDKEISEDNNLKFIFTNVLENIVMLKYLSGNATSGSIEETIIREQLSQSSLWKQIPREERAENIKNFFDSNTTGPSIDQPLIDNYSKKVGVFYQNFTRNKQSSINQKESLYISFAVFEDDFLNNYVATTVKKDSKGNTISETVDKTSDMPKFNSRNVYVRWDEDLFAMMKTAPRPSDKALSFLYPDTWDSKETSNRYKPTIIAERGKEREWEGTKDDRLKRRIPLRELFIRTAIIIESFEASSNINDALERLFDNIFEDSGNLINIRVMKNNDFESSLTFHDVNIEPIEKRPNETFKFDITSGNTIVQNVDLKFETPKAGLSSMIAIGGLSTPKLFDDFQLMRFNILNTIQSDTENKIQIRHLPIFGETIQETKDIDVNIGKILSSTPNTLGDTFSGRNKQVQKIDAWYKSYKKKQNEKIKELDKDRLDDPKDNRDVKELEDDKRELITANSERDVHLIKAKINSFIKTDANSISPVLPISLTLEIYGNNFLNIGDYFTINFLPEHFKERVYFQIVGVDHSVSTSNWKTTYNTVMRPYSDKKYYQFGSKKSDDLSNYVKVVPSGILLEDILNGLEKQSGLFNPEQKNMVRRFEILQQTELSIIEKVFMKSYLVHYFPKALSTIYQDNVDMTNKVIIMSGNYKSVKFKEEVLAWLIAMSDLMLGDEIIDWKKWKETAEKDDLASLPEFFAVGDNNMKSEDKFYQANPGQVWVGSQKYRGEEVGDMYRDIQSSLNTIYKTFGWFDEIGLDPFQEAIDTFLTNYNQTISTHIGKQYWKGSGFHFLYRIDWPINPTINYDENQLENQFKIINFTNNDCVKSFPVIQIPSLYLKGDVKSISNKIWEKYHTILRSILEITSRIEKEVELDYESNYRPPTATGTGFG